MGPDWELVTDSATNHLTSYAKEHRGLDLDWDRIAVAGPSLGGYFALRSMAGAFNAYVAVDPL
jgi:predicted dienelactone hydrolase